MSTFPEFTRSRQVLAAFSEALERDARLSEQKVSLGPDGALVATALVPNLNGDASAHTAIDAFYDALRAAGFDVDQAGWQLNVESVDVAGQAGN